MLPRSIAGFADAAPIAFARQAAVLADQRLPGAVVLVHDTRMSATAILKLQRAGFTEEQVEALAEYFEAGTATKADIAALERRLDALERKIDITRSDLELAIERVRSDLERRIDTLRSDLELKIAEGKAETIKWVVGIGFAQIATILTVLKLFPSIHL